MSDSDGRKRKRPYKTNFTPEKFWARITTPEDLSECWEWKDYKLNGYGQLTHQGKRVLAHRLAWELTFGPIPKREGKDMVCVLHKCDNPSCCNPNHLFLGTRRHNMEDMISKGRDKHASGADHKSSKLTEEQIREIRKIGTTKPRMEIAKMFGVSRNCIRYILVGLTHKKYLESSCKI